MTPPPPLVVLSLVVLVAVYFIDRFLSKRAERKRTEGRLAAQRAIRTTLDDTRPTMAETLEMEINVRRSIALTGDDDTFREIAIHARLAMEADLGKYADGPKPYQVDQAHRDILLAHARRDAAEALLTSQAVLHEVRSIKGSLASLTRTGLFVLVVYVLWLCWKAGVFGQPG
jgi:hypothetical protein